MVGSSVGFSSFLAVAILRRINVPMGKFDDREVVFMDIILMSAQKVKHLVLGVLEFILQGAGFGATSAALLA